ncbi:MULTISPECIES: CsxC family protein [unclassified Cytobacillus]|jgi:hypothetical protein|uniref:CsxC family protein n=1 Tax=unclassified Cytobacillus TaxID=2675268 RepID=UPI00135CB4D7|nr:hypothetical protein [Cytobacillus sp. AMY 15.2]KAF0817869.1 hypothetical protein KIS4809_3387 [Bacillus sp. ZZV12-4809]MCM3089957.1 hypothetical protein [Cytobacillus sp. AMY 15.2]
MKKNTGCGNNGHSGSCDVSRTKTVDCFTRSFAPIADIQNVPVYDIPVVLAEVELQADVEADIKLPTPAREIKWIRKNVSLKQCKAIPSIQNPGYVKLFVTGVVHKNIQYVEECSGYITDFSTDIDFSCNQQVKVFNTPLEFPSRKSSVDERRFLDKTGHGADHTTGGSRTFEFYNDPIDCKLIFSEVNDLDLFKEFNRFGQFEKITEKMEITLFFKLLQNQQFNPKFVQPPKKGACNLPWPAQKVQPQATAREKFVEKIQGMYRIR